MTSTSDYQSQFVERDGFRFHYTKHGSGSPLVLLHGGGPGATGLSNYRHNIDALSAQHTLYVVDMPGYGQSSKQFDRSNPFEALGDSLKSLLDGLGLEKASLVGNSLGGAAALWCAIKYPDRVDRLILMGPGGGLSLFSPSPSAGIIALVTYYMGDGPSMEKMAGVIRNLVYDQSVVTPELIKERYEASLDPEVVKDPPLKPPGPHARTAIWREPALAQLPHKTLIIWGMEDRTNPVDQAFSLAKIIPNAELYLLSKCGHWAQWEKPAEFHDAVLTFLARA